MNQTFKKENVYLSEEIGEYKEWNYKKQRVPKKGQYLIDPEDKTKYTIKEVVIYTDEFTMINDYSKSWGKKKAIDETKYDNCFWNRLSDRPECHISFLVCCDRDK
jgi:hypothetical protein